MIKMVVTDMDGTLLDNHSEISEENLNAIHRLEDNHIEFTIASGRDFHSVYSVMEQYDLKCEAILGNGSQYVDKDGKILMDCYMDKRVLKDVVSIFAEAHLYYMIFATNGFYTGYDPSEAREAFVIRGITKFGRTRESFEPGGKSAGAPCNHLIKIEDMDEFLSRDLQIIKVEGFALPLDKAEEAREKLKHIPSISYLSSFNDNIEVTDQNAQKGLILEKVIGLKGLKKEEVMVLGDGMNDLSLFQCFPDWSFAPENAEETIKKLAHEVVASNDKGGFAQAVDRMFAEQKADQ